MVVADVGMAIEWKVSGVQRDVGVDETGNTTIGGTHQWPETTPEDPVVDQEAVGVLLRCLTNGGLAQVDGGSDTIDLARVADLKAIEGLGCVSHFFCYAEILIKKTDQSV